MRLPLTIRLTKDVEAEAMARAKANRARNKVVAKLLDENVKLRKVLRRWGLDQGIYDRGGSQKSKTPRGAGVSV